MRGVVKGLAVFSDRSFEEVHKENMERAAFVASTTIGAMKFSTYCQDEKRYKETLILWRKMGAKEICETSAK